MALVNLVDTTFTAKNISTALSVYEYTVPGTALWYHLYIQVRLYQVAGGGDYTVNLRLNDGDAQADDPMVPKTTYTAAAGAQNLWFQGETWGISGDVFNIMCVGQAGDAAVTGSIRIACDDSVGATTYGRTLDVTATGAAGVDWANVEGQTTTVGLSGTTIKAVTDAVSVNLPTASLVSAVTGAAFPIYRGDTLAQSLTVGALTGYVSVDFMLKADPGDADTAAIIHIRKNASGTSDGLLRLNGSNSGLTAADGTITISDEATGAIIVNLKADDTALLAPSDNYYWEVQRITATAVNTKAAGVGQVSADIVRAVA